jgi:hypothetical protein
VGGFAPLPFGRVSRAPGAAQIQKQLEFPLLICPPPISGTPVRRRGSGGVVCPVGLVWWSVGWFGLPVSGDVPRSRVASPSRPFASYRAMRHLLAHGGGTTGGAR